MTKNKPLKCSKTIWQVLGIGCFLFCAAIFGGNAEASIYPFHDIGYGGASSGSFASARNSATANNEFYHVLGSPGGMATGVNVVSGCSTYINNRALMVLENVAEIDWVNSSTSISVYYGSSNSSLSEKVPQYLVVATSSSSTLSATDYALVKLTEMASYDYFNSSASTGWKTYFLNDYGKQFLQDHIGENVLFGIISHYDLAAETPSCGSDILYYEDGYPSTGLQPYLAYDYVEPTEALPEGVGITDEQGGCEDNFYFHVSLNRLTIPTPYVAFLKPENAENCSTSTTGWIGATLLTQEDNIIQVANRYEWPGVGTTTVCIGFQNQSTYEFDYAAPYTVNIWAQSSTECQLSMLGAFGTLEPSRTATTTHDLACSIEQWNSTSTWDVLVCRLVETGLNVSQKFSDLVEGAIGGVANVAVNLFPFSIPIKILDCWNASQSQPLPADLEWLNLADENGNIYVETELESGATTSILFFGPAIFEDGEKITEFFQHIRTLTYYSIWGGLIIGIILLGRKVKEEISYRNVLKRHEEENYQL